MKALEEKTLEEILLANDPKEKEIYFQQLSNLSKNRISRQIVEQYKGDSINDIWQKVYEQESLMTSSSFFSGDIVILYPNIREYHSKSYITCDFSGAIIKPGSLYINYRPLIENLTTNNIYVLKRTIKVESGYFYDLPTTIQELETLELNIQLETPGDRTGIDYSHLSQCVGGSLILQKLKRRKGYENSDRK